MEVIAKAKYTRGSAQRARLVADTIRGKKATYAAEMLQFLPKRASEKVRKALESALANAVNNFGLSADTLIVSKVQIDEAPMFKRSRIYSRGRVRSLLKRNSHITIVLSDETNKVAAKPAKKQKQEPVKVDAEAAKPAKTKTSKSKKSVKSEN